MLTLRLSALLGIVCLCGCSTMERTPLMEAVPSQPAAVGGKVMRVMPRYESITSAPGTEVAEANYYPKELDWRVPVEQTALVCIDCWNWHFSRDCLERINACTERGIVPLLEACRKNGMLVIHAPADPVASRHPNWVKLMPKDAKPQAEWPDSPEWPPEAFKKKTGPYAQYQRPAEPQHAERVRFRETKRDFDPRCRPVGDEPVVRTGEELHRLCAQRGILHLFFIGFNTNACVMMRDYGMPAMNKLGYHVILVRDCTTGMEVAETVDDLTCTRGTIKTIEQFIGYSVTSGQLVNALNNATPAAE